MPQARGGGGVMSTISKGLLYLVIAGAILALLRAFNWDPFGIIDWLWAWVSHIVVSIADWMGSNPGFRRATEAPSILSLL